MVKVKAECIAKVKRGPVAWQFIYTFLGFALTIEAGVMSLVTPLRWPWNLITYVFLAIVTFRLCLYSRWFQNKLIGWKQAYEDVAP